MKRLSSIILTAATVFGAAYAQTKPTGSAAPVQTDIAAVIDSIYIMPDSAFFAPRSLDELHAALDTVNMYESDPEWRFLALPRYSFRPAVYEDFIYADSTTVETPLFSGEEALRWLEEEQAISKRAERMNRYLFFNHPEVVPYNINLLPEAPKRFHAVVDPQQHTIEIQENIPEGTPTATLAVAEVQKKHWIKTFESSLQFSQAYVSPNWYQGGNNNLNILGNIFYNVKLNPKYHPNILFETTAQYKLGLNSTPDDSIHSFNISDDLLQINTTLGIKAVKKWYYSFNAQFKTQLFNNYPTNSRQLRSAFLSPGELIAGIGMTYNTTDPKKRWTFDASISPLSYTLRTCTNHRINPTLYNIDEGRTTKHKFGSSAELKLGWKIYYNITLASRLFMFTDYESFQADWENTVSFDITRFLTTKIYVHARFDSKTPQVNPDSSWKKLQIKEILSIGVTYRFSSI